MLKKTESITLSGQSKVTYGNTETIAVQLSANVVPGTSSNQNKVIVNKEAYEANKAECDADVEEFEEWVKSTEA